jgi:hypothetical protein
MSMEGEIDKPGHRNAGIPIRVGQNWEIEGGVLEISSISDKTVEGIPWTGTGKRLSEGGIRNVP